jgi:hypothetical protein
MFDLEISERERGLGAQLSRNKCNEKLLLGYNIVIISCLMKRDLKVAMPITMWMATKFNCDLITWIHGPQIHGLAIGHMGQSNLLL